MGLLSDVADVGKDVIDDRRTWADRFKTVGDFIERNAKGDRLERVAKVGRKLGDFSAKFSDFFESSLGKRLIKAAKSPILAAGQHVIGGMKLTTGMGDPEAGARFGQGAEQVGAAGETLNTAFPTGDWDSVGSTAYAGRNDEQVGRAQAMLGADRLVAAVLSREAHQIAVTRDNLDDQSDWLGDMSLITMATGCIPYVGKAAQITAEIAMVSKAVGESTQQLMSMQDNASANAAEVREAVSAYESVTGTANPADGDFDPTAAETTDTETADAETPGGEPEAAAQAEPGAPQPGPSTQPPLATPATPGMTSPAGMPGGAMAAPQSAGVDVAGVIGSVMGAVMGPLGGLLGGVMQAAGQAAQAGQAAGRAPDPALAETDAVEKAASGGNDEGKDDKAEDGKRDRGADTPDAEVAVEADDGAGTDDDPAGDGDEAAAMTLPPDLGAASAGGTGAGLHNGADFDRGQLHIPAAVRVERGIPGSASAIDT